MTLVYNWVEMAQKVMPVDYKLTKINGGVLD